VKLYTYFRSSAAYRVRIALNLKGVVPEEVIQINLIKGEQRQASFRAVNPMMAIPALSDGDGPALFESLAIIEYLDETHPNPPLLPRDPKGRARVRGLAQIVACDSHPLIVPRVREYLAHEFKFDEAAVGKWCRHWHTAAITMRLLATSDAMLATGVIGTEISLKWQSATRPGDLLHLEITVGAITPSGSRPDRGSVILAYETINQYGEIRQQTSGRVIAWRRPQPRT